MIAAQVAPGPAATNEVDALSSDLSRAATKRLQRRHEAPLEPERIAHALIDGASFAIIAVTEDGVGDAEDGVAAVAQRAEMQPARQRLAKRGRRGAKRNAKRVWAGVWMRLGSR